MHSASFFRSCARPSLLVSKPVNDSVYYLLSHVFPEPRRTVCLGGHVRFLFNSITPQWFPKSPSRRAKSQCSFRCIPFFRPGKSCSRNFLSVLTEPLLGPASHTIYLFKSCLQTIRYPRVERAFQELISLGPFILLHGSVGIPSAVVLHHHRPPLAHYDKFSKNFPTRLLRRPRDFPPYPKDLCLEFPDLSPRDCP